MKNQNFFTSFFIFFLCICTVHSQVENESDSLRVIDLHNLLPNNAIESNALSVNNLGVVSGYYTTSESRTFPVVWFRNEFNNWVAQILNLPLRIRPMQHHTKALSINDANSIVGIEELTTLMPGIPPRVSVNRSGLKWSLDENRNWTLDQYPIKDSIYTGINNSEEISVSVEKRRTKQSFLKSWNSDRSQRICKSCEPNGINDLGNVIGVKYNRLVGIFRLAGSFAYYNKQGARAIEKLPPRPRVLIPSKKATVANDINNQSNICGYWHYNSTRAAALWLRINETWTSIDLSQPEFPESQANGINDLTEVVGNLVRNGKSTAFIYKYGLHRNHCPTLTCRIEQNVNWTKIIDDLTGKNNVHFAQANDINNSGWVVGNGYNNSTSSNRRALLAIPFINYHFETLDFIPIEVNNRNLVIGRAFDFVPQLYGGNILWQLGVGEVYPRSNWELQDLNDDFHIIESTQPRVLTYSIGPNGLQYTAQVLAIPTSNIFFVTSISNSNEIIGGSRVFTSGRASGFIWNANEVGIQILPSRQIDISTNGMWKGLNLQEINTSRVIMAKYFQQNPANNSAIGLFSQKFNMNYPFTSSGGANHRTAGVNSSGICALTLTDLTILRTNAFYAEPPFFHIMPVDLGNSNIIISKVNAINDVGWMGGMHGDQTPFLKLNNPFREEFVNPNALLSTSDGKLWTILEVTGINDRNTIIGRARSNTSNEIKGFVLVSPF